MAAPSQTILINSDAVGQTIGVIYSTSANAATWYSKIDTIIDLPSTQDIICKVKQTSNDASNPIYLNYGTQMALTRIA